VPKIDDLKLNSDFDRGGMLAELEHFPEQLQEASNWELA